ncbi:MAG: DUF3078 domain-containing protein [Bacteroidales bacterium]|nr:DUF3078 domain-containing protein [Bacteroidales bacterium]
MNRLFFLIFVLNISVLSAQDSTKVWKYGGTGVITISQVSLTNWAAGGENSVSSVGELNLFAKYEKNNISFDNILKLAYGTIKQGEKPIIKSDDRIDFSSKIGRKASEKWYYAFLFNFKTQFADGYNYPNDSVKISGLMAPAFMVYSLGMDYKPDDKLSMYFSPLTGKTTIVSNKKLSDEGAFGVTAGEEIRMELGGYLKMTAKHDLMENIVFENTVELFSNYIENPGNIDINWISQINMKVNKYLSANISTQLIYDDDIKIVIDDATGQTAPKMQFKEVFGLGLSFKF